MLFGLIYVDLVIYVFANMQRSIFGKRSNCFLQRNRILPRFVYDVGTFNFAIQKLCTLQTSFCTITRDTIERNEIGGRPLSGRAYSYLAPTFCMRFVHNAVHRKLSSTTSVIWLQHVCPPVSPLHSVPTRNSDVSAYIYSVLWKNMRAFFGESLRESRRV